VIGILPVEPVSLGKLLEVLFLSDGHVGSPDPRSRALQPPRPGTYRIASASHESPSN
jgi:hypothetical protein